MTEQEFRGAGHPLTINASGQIATFQAATYSYAFRPAPDLTAAELAHLLFATIPMSWADNLVEQFPAELRRHFVRRDE